MAEIQPRNETLPVDGKAEKKAFAKAKSDHDLHVLLLMKNEDISKSNAIVKAYAQGRAALAGLLGK